MSDLVSMDTFGQTSGDAGASHCSVAGTLTSTSVSPLSTTPPSMRSRRRSWFGFASPSALTSPGRSKITSRRDSKEPNNVEILEMEPSRGTGTGGTSGTTSASTLRRSADSGTSHRGDGEDDAWGVAPVSTGGRKTSKGNKNGGQLDDGEAVKMDDLSPRPTEEDIPGGPPRLPRASLPPRTFSRTASGRDQPVLALSHDNRRSLSPTLPNTTTYPERTSTDRPLPSLPNGNIKVLPSVPHEIFVTPSSPRKSSKRPTKKQSMSSLGKGQHPEPGRRSRSATRLQSTADQPYRRMSFNLGIGLPRGQSDSQAPPPVPSKPQSVSSPYPSRGPSPVPRIVFAEPDMPSKEGSTADSTEKKSRVRRARSLSGILSKSPVVDDITSRSSSRPGSRPNSRLASPFEPEKATDEVTVKASGVLGWFGVKKTVKRRQSESKLRGEDSVWPRSRSPIGSYRSATQSRESLGQQSNDGSSSRRPSPVGSTAAALPADSSTSKRSVFGRRPSSRSSDHSSGPLTDSKPIPIMQRRPQTANSSQSSLQLPVIDQSSAFVYFQPDNWTRSPALDDEETLFMTDGSSSVNWGPGVRPWMNSVEGGRHSVQSTLSSSLVTLPELAPIVQPSPTSTKPSTPFSDQQQLLQQQQQQQQSQTLPRQRQSQQTGRLRSWSDAPRPQQTTRPNNNSHPDLPQQAQTQHLQSADSLRSTSPLPLRPKLAHRPSSHNSAIMDRMRGVFSKSTSRTRSKTLSRQPSSDVDDFGVFRPDQRPGSSASVTSNTQPGRNLSTTENPHHALLGLSGAERHSFSSNTPDRAHRASVASNGSIGADSAQSVTLLEPVGIRKGRVRASTLSAATTYNFRPSSPQSFPLAATPPRRRPSVMQRLSNGVLRSGPSSPRGGALFPLPPKTSASLSSSFTLPTPDDAGSIQPRSRPGSVSAAVGPAIVAREEGETPEQWLKRVSSHIGRDEIANALAASSDEFHKAALQIFMSRFDFTHNALDVALRRLLMHMSLPSETQQIDRVIEAFAVRYEECEPGLFTSKDNTYVLAFSMMMLHTDAFNKHNKNKMTKPGYVRNTRLDNVPPLVLETFFDNITFTPFVFFEDDADLVAAKPEPSSAASSLFSTTPTYSAHSAPLSAKSGKIDVYHMIVRNLLGSLRVQMEHEIPPDTPFSCLGTRPILDTDVSHRAFVEAKDLAIVPPRRKSSTGGLLSTTPSKSVALPDPELVLKVTKASVLFRKDDEVPGKKSRKWKSWSVILTGSQLLFFKDSSSVLPLMDRLKAALRERETGMTAIPRLDNFKPDEVYPVKDCFAVYDRAYTQNPHTFRFVMPQHRQYLLQADDEYEMNEWINLINYASAFKTANLRIRGSAMGKDRAVLAGTAAAASHKRDLDAMESPFVSDSVQSKNPKATDSSSIRTPRRPVFGDVFSPPPGDAGSPLKSAIPRSPNGTSVSKVAPAEVDGVGDVVDEGEQLEQVFDAVKAELAAGRGSAGKRVSAVKGNIKPSKEHAPDSAAVSRAEAIQTQVKLFEARVKTARAILHANLRTARNLAILTPFQKVTRDRIAQAVPQLSQKIRNNRLDIVRLQIWIDILRGDAVTEQREMARVRHVALQAAAKSLRDPFGGKGVVEDVNSEDGPGRGSAAAGPGPGLGSGVGVGLDVVPTLALPDGADVDVAQAEDGEDAAVADVFGKSPIELPVHIRQPSERTKSNGKGSAKPTTTAATAATTRPQLAQQYPTRSYKSSSSLNDLNRSSSELPGVSRSGSPGDADRMDVALDGSGSISSTFGKGGEVSPEIFNLSDVEEGSAADHPVVDIGDILEEKSQQVVGARQRANGSPGRRRSGNQRSSKESLRGHVHALARTEEAEEWMKTRAARRVSLATIPDLHRVASGASAKVKGGIKISD